MDLTWREKMALRNGPSGAGDASGRSNPLYRFKDLKIPEGPLNHFNERRPQILDNVVERTLQELRSQDLNDLMEEALFTEKARLRSEMRFRPDKAFIYPRLIRDKKVWRSIQSGLLRSSVEVDRKDLLEKALYHYAEEIGGHFSPHVYRLATHAVPFFFSWLLNAASVRKFIPWKMAHQISDRLRITGEVAHLQKLADKGTILLVPTHQSNIDSVLIGYVIYLMGLPPFAYGAGLNLFSNPILSFFMSNLGAYTVDRKKENRVYKKVLKNYSTEILKEGTHSIFFPGGGRSRSGAIESHLKLGLLGTGLAAQLQNMKAGLNRPVYVVPMITSYDFVLEAGSLIEDFLMASGKHRFLPVYTEETPAAIKSLKFFWTLFSSKNVLTVRVGKPLDVFGNFVDEQGQSIGPNGTTIDPKAWLTTCGELREEVARDHEYTRRLGDHLVERYYRENIVVPSHLVAFSFFMSLRRKYPELNLYRFLRLSVDQRTLPFNQFLKDAEEIYKSIQKLHDSEELYLSQDLLGKSTEQWVREGIRDIGNLHESAVIRLKGDSVTTDDMRLLYYYRNRLSGYGVSLRGFYGRVKRLRGGADELGFLA